VVVRSPDRRGHRSRHVAVLDELDAGARGTDLLNEIVVACAIEDDRRDVPDSPAEGLGDCLDVLGHRAPEIDLPPRDWPNGHLPHVHVGKRLKGSRLADGDHRHRAAPASGHDAAAFERIQREIDRLSPLPDPVAGLQYLELPRRPDHDPAVDRQELELLVHARCGRIQRCDLIGAPQPARAGERRAFGRPRIALADAGARHASLRLDPLGLGNHLAHTRTSHMLSAAVRTSSITPAIAFSRSLFSITGTCSTPARSTMKSWR
jgi:hypothetical protein